MTIIKQNPYKSIVVEDEHGRDVTISEGDKIRFCTEGGELKKGYVTKLQGKDDKLKIQIVPVGGECEEIWSLISMADGSLNLDTEEGQDIEVNE